MKRERVAIIGGGIAGITAANELGKCNDYEVILFEKLDSLGGLNKSINIDSVNYDIGSFLYWNGHEIFNIFPFLKEIYKPIKHLPIVIKSKNVYDIHPLTIKGYLDNFGLLNFVLSIFSLFCAKIKYMNYSTLPEYCKYYLGNRIYIKSGLQIYIQRLYKKEDVDVDMKLGYSRIRGLQNYSFRKLLGRINTVRSDMIFNSGERQCYARPKEGFFKVFELLEEHLISKNINIEKKSNILSIKKFHNKFIIKTDSNEYIVDRIISTIPFTITQRLIGLKPNYYPTYMTLLTLFYEGVLLKESDVIYNFTNQGNWKRINVFSKYYGLKNNKDYISVEITLNSQDTSTIEFFKSEFESNIKYLGIFEDLEYKGNKLTPYAYPVFGKGEIEKADNELKRIKSFGIDLIGRQGTFEYLSSDETIRTTVNYINKTFSILK